MFQGLLRAHPEFHDNKNNMVRLWIHECFRCYTHFFCTPGADSRDLIGAAWSDVLGPMTHFRVFSDRLIDRSDMDAFTTLLGEKMGSLFDLVFHNVCPDKQPPVFGT